MRRMCFVVRLVLVVAFCLAGLSGAAGDIDPPVRAIGETRLVSTAEFTRKNIEAMVQRYLDSHQPNYALLSYTIGTDKLELVRSMGQFMQSPAGIQNVRNYLPKNPIAQVIAFDGCAVLRYRDQTGFSEYVVRGSRDPTQFSVGGVQHKLLHFALIRQNKVFLGDRDHLMLFFQSMGPLTTANAGQLAVLMRRKAQLAAVHVSIRQDTWFIANEFPEVYPFVEKIVVPTIAYFRETKTVSCSVTSKQPRPTCSDASGK